MMRALPLLPLIALAIVASFVVVVLFTAIFFLSNYRAGPLPSPDELQLPEPSIVRDAAGDVIAKLDPGAVRSNIELDELPDHVWQAILAVEDRNFYEHEGYSTRGIIRAFWTNLIHGEIRQGGSTITQQYVDIAIREVPRTYRGKLRELAYARKLEGRLGKDQILEYYLNAVPFGRGALGIEAAAQTYFGKAATELSVNEAATLAGMVAAPSRYDPGRHPEVANERREIALRGMAEEGWLPDAEADQLIAEGLPELRDEPLVEYGTNAYYLDAVQQALADELGDEQDIYLGLDVTTELDTRLQELALTTLNAHLADVPYTGAMVSIDPTSGAVKAVVGGRDFRSEQFNIAIRGGNQAGSAFKPFGLAAWLDQGRSLEEVFPAPAQMVVNFDDFPPYDVSNFGNAGFGQQNVRQATLTSTNVVYAQIASEVGPEAVKQMAVAAGINDTEDLVAVPSLILGTVDVTPLDMAQGYATFAAGGERHEPRFIRTIRDIESGQVVLDAERARPERAMQADVAYGVTDVLIDNIQEGTGTSAQLGRPAAGKTGTTDDFRDAWFVGYVPQLATAVWIGNADNTPMARVTGSSIPAETWGDYMGQAVAPLAVEQFPEPNWDTLVPRSPTPTDRSPVPVDTFGGTEPAFSPPPTSGPDLGPETVEETTPTREPTFGTTQPTFGNTAPTSPQPQPDDSPTTRRPGPVETLTPILPG
ncbi:MAG: penicillin-binding protein [Actinomycetota bacterium]|nr:penicillin-binding protein [Actinomycetota bacterium]